MDWDLLATNTRTGLAAPAIAAGLGALAPTLGTIIPFVGAGAAAFASAAGTVVGSVAVAASFGGKLKMQHVIFNA